MTDRLVGVTVTFDRDIRDDDAEPILEAIKMLKHVVHVEPVVRDEAWMVETRTKNQVAAKLVDFIREELY